jgi:hypothetical protein
MARPKVFEEAQEAPSDETAADQNSNGASGWEVPQESTTPIGVRPHKGKHRFRDGVCTKCGAIEGQVQPRQQRTSLSPRGKTTIGIPQLISAVWMAAGIGLEKQPWILQEPVQEGMAPPAVAVARVIKLESAVAGKRIDKALRGTPVYAALTKLLDVAGPWAELAPLFAPPLIIGLASIKPELGEQFRPMLVASLIPVLIESTKMAEEQARLLAQFEGVTAEVVQQANAIVDSLLSKEDDSSTPS